MYKNVNKWNNTDFAISFPLSTYVLLPIPVNTQSAAEVKAGTQIYKAHWILLLGMFMKVLLLTWSSSHVDSRWCALCSLCCGPGKHIAEWKASLPQTERRGWWWQAWLCASYHPGSPAQTNDLCLSFFNTNRVSHDIYKLVLPTTETKFTVSTGKRP